MANLDPWGAFRRHNVRIGDIVHVAGFFFTSEASEDIKTFWKEKEVRTWCELIAVVDFTDDPVTCFECMSSECMSSGDAFEE
jgi:hypothetical protein